MIPVSKAQAAYIKERSPTTFITTTSRDKSKSKRKKRYAPETPTILRLIKELENENKGGI